MLMVKVLYRKQRPASDALAFVLEISKSKISSVLVGQLPKIVMKFSNELSKNGILADMIQLMK